MTAKQSRKMVGKVLRRNIAIGLATVILFSVILVCIMFSVSHRLLKEQIYSIESEKLQYTGSVTQATFEQIATLNGYFSSIEIKKTDALLSNYDMYWNRNIQSQVTLSVSVFDYINSITISKDGEIFKSNGDLENEDPAAAGSVHIGQLKATDIYYVPDEQLSSPVYFTLFADDNNYASNTVNIGVNAQKLSKLLISENSELQNEYIINDGGTVVFARNPGLIGRELNEIFGIEADMTERSTEIIRINGEKKYLTVQRVSDEIGLYTVSLADTALYEQYYTQANRRNIVLSIVILFISCAVATLIIYKTYQPINQILHTVDRYVTRPLYDSTDEVQYINSRLEKIYSSNSELQNSLADAAKQLREQQVAALQAQICPHFIYNTLDAISWMAMDELGRKNPISSSVGHMAAVLRSSMDMNTMISRLDKEIEITEQYVQILYERYDNRFEVIWDIDQSLLDCVILKLCIQPVIENAVCHGFPDSTQKGIIRISVLKHGDDIAVEVRDNGTGIAEDQLAQLQKSINQPGKDQAGHIGMRNVNLRLKLLYGEPYGLYVSSEYGKGTVCTLLIPRDTL